MKDFSDYILHERGAWVKNFGEMASLPQLDYFIRITQRNFWAPDHPQLHESESPRDAGAPLFFGGALLFLISIPDDSGDEPGVENAHLVRKQVPRQKKSHKRKCQLAKHIVGRRRFDVSVVLPWKVLENRPEDTEGMDRPRIG